MTIEISGLRKEYETGSGTEVAVDGIDLRVEDGEFVVLVGPSGCGKSTTLRCIAGLERPTSGEVGLNGEDVSDTPTHKRNLAMMFQNIALYPHMTIRENIAYPLKVRSVPKRERGERAREAASIMKIEELLDKYPKQLSGGQRQRAALARCVVLDPVAFLMDEPLSDLDANLKVQIRKEIQRVQNQVGKSTVYVTHDQEEAMTMGDRIAVLNDGEVEQVGTPDELYEFPENVFVARFIGNPNMNFLESTLEQAQDDVISVAIQDQVVDLPFAGDVPSRDVVLGVRPEDIGFDCGDDAVCLEGKTQLVERVNDRKQVTLESANRQLIATVPAATSVPEGEPVEISIDKEKIFIFDAKSEDLIGSTHSRTKKAIPE